MNNPGCVAGQCLAADNCMRHGRCLLRRMRAEAARVHASPLKLDAETLPIFPEGMVTEGGECYPPLRLVPDDTPAHDPVNHPSHYTQGAVECIDALEAALGSEAFVNYCRAAAIKYLWRMGRKDEATQELRKAVWYVNRAVETLRKMDDPKPPVGAVLDRVA